MIAFLSHAEVMAALDPAVDVEIDFIAGCPHPLEYCQLQPVANGSYRIACTACGQFVQQKPRCESCREALVISVDGDRIRVLRCVRCSSEIREVVA